MHTTGTDCSNNVFCAFHSAINVSATDAIAYAALPYPNDLAGCPTLDTPNGNAYGDSLANLTSHEQFEAISDPYPCGVGCPYSGWVDSAGYEVADKCVYDFAAGDVALNNYGSFSLQEEYSNALSACVPTAPAHISVSPSSVSVSTVYHSTNPSPQTITLTNANAGSMGWDTRFLPSWVSVSPTYGTLTSGATQKLTLTFNLTTTNPGTNTFDLLIDGVVADNTPLRVPITATVLSPKIEVTPNSVSVTTPYGSNPAPQTLTLRNTGDYDLNWSATAGQSWFSVSPTSGTLAPGASQTLTLTFHLATWAPRAYSSVLTISNSHASNSPYAVPMSATVTPVPHLQASPAAIGVSTTPGVSPPNQTFSIQNSGTGTLNWSLDSGSLPSWVSVSPTSGSVLQGDSQTVTLSFAIPGTDGPQTYTTKLQFTDPNADNSPLAVPVTVVAHQVATSWYFAEGYSMGTNGQPGAFRTLFTLANPGAGDAHVTLTYNLTPASDGTPRAPRTEQLTVPAHGRATADPKLDIGLTAAAFSTTITSDQPLVAERPMYFWYRLNGKTVEGGFDTMGATSLGHSFNFAQFLVTSAHQSRSLFTVLNPTTAPLYATATFYPQAGGDGITAQLQVPANSRGTIDSWQLASNGTLAAGRYSAQVALSSDAGGSTPVEGLVERPMYSYASSSAVTISGYWQSTCVIGVPSAGTAWYFAEGYTGVSGGGRGQFHETLVLANPGANPAQVAISLAPPSPTSPGNSTSLTLNPHTLQLVDVNALLPNSANSASVTADQPILAERLLTFTTGATDALGAPSPSHEALFAESYTGGGFRDLVTLQNPSGTETAYVTVRALPTSASASPVTTTLVMPPRTRATVDFASLMPNQAFSVQVLATVPIVAERPMYFDFGGTDALGYQPPDS